VGPKCPLCGRDGCYNKRKPYWRYAIEIEPFKKEKVPIARFECRKTRRTFSLLPVQLIPYHLYTVRSIIRVIEQALCFEARGYAGCEAVVKHDESDSAMTPFLVWCWLTMVVQGFRRAHWLLKARYDLRGVRSGEGRRGLMGEAAGYQRAIGTGGRAGWPGRMADLPRDWVETGGHFFYGTSSQQRLKQG
jgi:hypothetical protein